MPPFWTFTLLLLHPMFATATLDCNKTDNCKCVKGRKTTEIQCPPAVFEDPKNKKIVMHVKESLTTKIDCYNFQKFQMNFLPNVTIPEATRLEMLDCPMPPKNFKQILDHFSMSKVRVLQFEDSVEDVILTKDSFAGFNDFERLKLNQLTFDHIDDDAFSEMPKLYSLEMENNRNLTLVSNLFRNLTHLNVLYLGGNELEDLPDGIFDPLESLTILHLFGNRLKVINDSYFSSLKNLTSLELRTNEMEAISENSFHSLSLLTSINLSENTLTTLSPNIFRNNRKIEKIYFMLNQDLQPPDYLFANLTSLKILDLSYCNLNSLPEHIFENSTNLAELNLNSNKLNLLSPVSLQGLVNLKVLDLSKNRLSFIEKDIFKDLTSLEEINLYQNQISTIDNRAFSNKRSLKIINLSHNQYSMDTRSGSILQECQSVKHLDLSYNSIEKVEDVISPLHVSHLESLDLSNNLIKEIQLTNLQQPSGKVNVNLDDNNITRISFKDIDLISGSGVTTLSLSKNPIECDCHSYELFQFVNKQIYQEKSSMFTILTDDLLCGSPTELKDQGVATLAPWLLTCLEEGPLCPSECTCTYCAHTGSIAIDCSFKNLTELPDFDIQAKSLFTFNQTEITLEGNDLKKGPRGDLESYYNVTRLNLSKNRIRSIEWLPPKLKELHLDNNELSHLDDEILTTLKASHLEALTLGFNLWTCDCDSVNFTNFLRENSKLMDVNATKCQNASILMLNLGEKELCPDKLVTFIVIPVLATFLLITTLLVLFYRCKKPIRIWLISRDLCPWWLRGEDFDDDKIYDAFISYSQRDEDFVVKELLPNLEGGENPHKLCIHQRNWTPGEMITTQITNSVLNSRRTVVVLSNNFLESVWGQMEFRTAHSHAMTEGRARVVIILYGEVDVDKLDEELKLYLKTNTYVKWEDPYFWVKIKDALPQKKVKSEDQNHTKNQKLTNLMRYIEDKFTLVVEDKDKSSTGVVSPALDRDSPKKNPPELMLRQDLGAKPVETGTLMVSVCS